MRTRFRPLLALAAVWLAVALACNLPVGPRERDLTPRQSARRTLEAQLFPTLQAAPATPVALPEGPPAGTSMPGPVIPEATPPGAPVTPPQVNLPDRYFAQSGDTLAVVAAHFGVAADQITSDQALPENGFLAPGQALRLPGTPQPAPYPNALLPDSEIVYGPSAADFDVAAFLQQAGGFLSTYRQDIGTETLSAAQIIQRIATETSTNPRVLLAVLEHRSGWVYGQPVDLNRLDYPVGFQVADYRGLWKEMTLTARQLTLGYYGWREGTLSELEFMGGSRARISPQLNAGSVAVQFLYTRLLGREAWEQALYGSNSLPATYQRMFGNPWDAAAQVEPLFEAGLQQPELQLPFAPGLRWSMTGGPHIAWGVGSPRAALDFAPVTGEPACQVSSAWATAAAAGLVVRSERAQLALDLDGDGSEQTGWVLFYYHLADRERAAVGTRVQVDDRLGHPSCEGGRSTGTHFHFARKYNGEWLAAGGPLPMVVGGWAVEGAVKAYEGRLVKGEQVVVARPDGEHDSIVTR